MTASASWPVWSTAAQLVVTDEDCLDRARAIAQEHLAEVDLAVSRFRIDSELMTMPAGGATVSRLCADLIGAALDAAERTGGRLDPTVGGALVALGYDRDFSLLAESDGAAEIVAVPVPGWRSVQVRGTTVVRPAAVQLDLGATAKAVTADQIAARIVDGLGCGVLVGLGGDIATAGDAPVGGWHVRVQDTLDDAAQQVTVAPGTALATSSTVRRTWRRDGEEMHHIIDPATGRPAPRVWRSVTVAAPTAHEANTLSTAALVCGTGAVELLCESGRAARLVVADHRIVTLGGWPRERAA